MKPALLPLMQIGILAFGYLYATSEIANAQVTSDGTVNTEVNQTDNVSEITGGETRGDNLFHSFQEFSVDAGNEAFFNNADAIKNIFSRVTGGNASTIDGLIRANNASLFLINPAGIIFGKDARLDIGGSFYGSSADSILFDDGEFSATDLDNPPVLTVNAPIGLGFRDNPADIANSSVANNDLGVKVGLEVDPENNLTLLGGDVSFNGGAITAPAGRVELGGLSAVGTIGFNNDGSLNFPEGVARGDVSLTNSSGVFVSSGGGGSIGVNAANLELSSGSTFFAGIGVDSGSVDAQAGDIVIDATDSVLIDGQGDSSAGIRNTNFGTGNVGNIIINARNIDFKNGGSIFISNGSQGNLGSITLTAIEDISFDGTNYPSVSGVIHFTGEEGTGDIGNIDITAQNLTLTNGAIIQSLVVGKADSANINIDVADNIRIDGAGDVVLDDGTSSTLSSQISSNVSIGGNGNSGGIKINTGSLNVTNDGQISASTLGKGDAGNLTIDAKNINITQTEAEPTVYTGIFADVDTPAEVEGGDIKITANDSIVVKGVNTFISAEVNKDAAGNAGSVTLNTSNLSILQGGKIGVRTFGEGNAGQLTIDANNIKITRTEAGPTFFTGIFADVETPAKVEGGDIKITAKDSIVVEGVDTFISAEVNADAAGNAGSVTLNTPNLSILRGGVIGVNTFGEGNAGNLEINAPSGTVSVDGEDSIIRAQVRSNATGNGGTVNIDTGTLNVTNEGQIDVSTFGQGDAGNLTIDANDINITQTEAESTILTGIFADVETPAKVEGGDIKITAKDSIVVEGVDTFISAEVNADAAGNAGSVTLNTPNLSILRGGVIGVNTFGQGDAGNLNINAPSGTVSVDGEDSIIRANVSSSAIGTGGNVNIDTSTVNLNNGGQISASTFGKGDAGQLTINVPSGTVSVDGENSVIDASVESDATGTGGNVNIYTGTLNLTNGGQISASTSSDGNAGNLTITASDLIELSGQGEAGRTGLFASATTGSGKGGDLAITTDRLSISDDATINVSNFQSLGSREPGTGEAGNLTIDANSVKLDTGGIITAATSSGNGGNITFSIDDRLQLDGNSEISAGAFDNAIGGNITINAPKGFVIGFPAEENGSGNDIIANAEGQGGTIKIDAEGVLGFTEGVATEQKQTDPNRSFIRLKNGSNELDVTSASGSQLDGSIKINIPDVNSLQGEINTPENTVDSQETVQQACSLERGTSSNTLAVKGKGGVPPAPDLPLNSQVITVNGQDTETQTNQAQYQEIKPIPTSYGDIIPAQGVIVTEDGRVILTAYRTDGNARVPQGSANCGK